MAAGAVSVPQIIALNYSPGTAVRRNGIDAGTKIEISTDTPGAYIYFTVDGSRPGESSKSTRKYKHAFSLAPGKYTVKAVAVTSDGRESAVASRNFTVIGIKGAVLEGRGIGTPDTGRSDGLNFISEISARSDRRERTRPTSSSKEAFSRHLTSAWAEELERQQRESQPRPERLPNEAFTEERTRSAIVKESMQPPTQPSRMLAPPGDVAHLYTCARCGLRLPPGSNRCVVCECDSILVTALPLSTAAQPAPVVQSSQIVPMPVTPWSAVSCLVCGVTNPPGVARCLSCSATLPTDMRPGFVGTTAPPMPQMHSTPAALSNTVTHTRCSMCARLNDVRARFCDWCSARLSPPTQNVTPLCSKCGSPLLSSNRTCFTCGTMAIPPSRDFDTRNASTTKPDNNIYMSQTVPVATTLPDPFRPSVNTGTLFKENKACQTIQTGAFVPAPNYDPNATPRDAKIGGIPTTSLSPGRGYWRQQLKHINAQLEAFASSSTDFRAAIGPHQLGRLIAARVTNSGGDEFVLRLVFNLPQLHNQRAYLNTRDTVRSGNAPRATTASTINNYDRGSLISDRSGINAYSKYRPRRPMSDLSAGGKPSGRRYGNSSSKYADLDDYVSTNRQIDRLAIDEQISGSEDDDLLTGSEEVTSDQDILDTFREESSRGLNPEHHLLYGAKRRTNQHFNVSSTPRRAGGRLMPRSSGAAHHYHRNRPISGEENATNNKPPILALKELGVDGAGRINELSRLFSEMNVDPAMKSREGWSLAHLAVINRHPDAIPVIAQYTKPGELDQALSCRGPGTAFGNTPLHEAVRLATSSAAALRALDALLSCGADVQKRNDRGETPFEYAQRLHHTEAAQRIASNLGKRRLQAAGLVEPDSKTPDKKSDLSD